MKLRINKLISDAGLGSRREVDDLIRRGRVRINGKRADLGDMVGVQDVVLFDDMDLPVKELIQEHFALEKVVKHEQAKDNKVRTKDRASERAESQRLQHASKSAALRKTSKAKARSLEVDLLEEPKEHKPQRHSGTRGGQRR